MIDLEHANRLMRNQEFSSGGPQSNSFHRALDDAIQSFLRPGDKIPPLPDSAAAGAWRTKWPIYEQLFERENRPPDPVVMAEHQRAATLDRDWNNSLQLQANFREGIRVGQITEDIVQYLGLKPGDLGPLTTNDPELRNIGLFKRLDWQEIHDRLERAWGRWAEMSDSEKRSIPLAMRTARAEQKAALLEKRLAALEANQPDKAA